MERLVYLIQTPPFWLKNPPLSLVYLKTYLEKQGLNIKIIDLNIELFKLLGSCLNQWLSLNKEFETGLFNQTKDKHPQIFLDLYKDIEQVDYIGFSLLKRNTPFAFSLAKEIKNRFPDKKIIFGGPHTLFLEKENKLGDNNYWVVGEGEIPLCKIIANGKNKLYRFREIDDLDTIPFYDFAQTYPQNYSLCLPLLSSRGCPYHCSFCTERLLYKKFRYHSPQYIVDQIKYLKSKYKTTSFVFLDSLINYKQKWLEDFCSSVIKNKLHIKWEAQIRIQKDFPLELAKLLKEGGCYNLFVGLESGSDNVLESMNKGFKAKDAIDFLKILKAANLHFEISLIFGYPGESQKEFKETLDFIVKNKKIIPKIAQANPFTDYLNDFYAQTLPPATAKKRMDAFLKTIEKEKIRYTKSFINNLIYK